MATITPQLKEFVAKNPHIKLVYFTKDGHYTVVAYPDASGKLFAPSRFNQQPGPAIVETVTRAEILNEPVATEEKTDLVPAPEQTEPIIIPEETPAPVVATEEKTDNNGKES